MRTAFRVSFPPRRQISSSCERFIVDYISSQFSLLPLTRITSTVPRQIREGSIPLVEIGTAQLVNRYKVLKYAPVRGFRTNLGEVQLFPIGGEARRGRL